MKPIKIPDNWQPIQVFVRHWLDDDTGVQRSAKTTIDFEAVDCVEEYVDGKLTFPDRKKKPPLTVVTTIYGGCSVIESPFMFTVEQYRIAQAYSSLNNISFTKS